jgi:hypothetical protein
VNGVTAVFGQAPAAQQAALDDIIPERRKAMFFALHIIAAASGGPAGGGNVDIRRNDPRKRSIRPRSPACGAAIKERPIIFVSPGFDGKWNRERRFLKKMKKTASRLQPFREFLVSET